MTELMCKQVSLSPKLRGMGVRHTVWTTLTLPRELARIEGGGMRHPAGCRPTVAFPLRWSACVRRSDDAEAHPQQVQRGLGLFEGLPGAPAHWLQVCPQAALDGEGSGVRAASISSSCRGAAPVPVGPRRQRPT